MTIPRPDLKFKACGRCQAVYYCSKVCKRRTILSSGAQLITSQACQVAARTHHHKFECKVLSELNVPDSPYLQQLLDDPDFRCWVRLLRLHKKRGISQEQMDEFIALPAPKTPKMVSAASDKWLEDTVEVIEVYVDPAIDKQDIERVMRMVSFFHAMIAQCHN